MATKTWIGAAGAAWGTAGNWSPSGIPASADDIVFTGDASPTISTTARTCANLTINGGTVSIAGTAAFTITGTITNNGSLTIPASTTIQGSINNNGYMETPASGTTTLTGGNNQVWNIGSHNFNSITINKTAGTSLSLGGALNILRTTTATLTYTAGNLIQNGYSISCRAISATSTGVRQWSMDAVVDVTSSSTTPFNISGTNLTFTNKNTFTVSPQSGAASTTITISGVGGSVTAANSATAIRSNNPRVAIYTNLNDGTYRNWILTGFWESIDIQGNFTGPMACGFWSYLNGNYTTFVQGSSTSEVSVFALMSSNQETSTNYLARLYRFTTVAGGVPAGTVLTNSIGRFGNTGEGIYPTNAFIYDLNCQYLYIELNISATYTGWTNSTVNCAGANCTYAIIGYTDNAASTINFSGANSIYNLYYMDTLGTVNHTNGTIYLNQNINVRSWSTSGGNRHYAFQDHWIIVNGSHRTGVNGTGTFTTSTQTAGTTLTTDSATASGPNNGGGIWLETSGSCSFGTTWSITSIPNVAISSLNNALLTQLSTIYARTLYIYGAVALGTSSTSSSVNITHGITWDGNSPVAHTLFRYCNLIYIGRDEYANIDCRPYGDPTNINYRFLTITTAAVAGTSTVDWNIYATSFVWSRPGGTCNLGDVYLTAGCTFSPSSGDIIVNITGPLNTSALALSPSGTTNATFNISGFSTTIVSPFNTSLSCNSSSSGTVVYNLYQTDLTGNNTSNRILFDGNGTLNLYNLIRTGLFQITNTTVARTINFNTNCISVRPGGSISVNLTSTSIITTPAKYSYSGAGGIMIAEGNVGTLTVSGQTQANALNLVFTGGYTATLGGTFLWRNIVTSTDSYFGGGAGYLLNAAATVLNVCGDLLLRYGEFDSPRLAWGTYTINLNGTDSAVPQFVANGGGNMPLGTVNLTGASPKIMGGTWAHNSDNVYVKTLTVTGATVVTGGIIADIINANSNSTFNAYSNIYVNRWNTDGSTIYWNGNGYLDIGNPISRDFPGWTSVPFYTNTAGTGPSLIAKPANWQNGYDGGIAYDSQSTIYNVKNYYLSNSEGNNQSFYVAKNVIYAGGVIATGTSNLNTPSGGVNGIDMTYSSQSGGNPLNWTSDGSNSTVFNIRSLPGGISVVMFKLPDFGKYYVLISQNVTGITNTPIIGIYPESTVAANSVGATNAPAGTSISVCTNYFSSTDVTDYYTIGARPMYIDCDARILTLHDGRQRAFPTRTSKARPNYYFIIADSSAGGNYNIDLSWANPPSGWAPFNRASGYDLTASGPIIYLNHPSATNNVTKGLSSTQAMSSPITLSNIASTSGVTLDLLPGSQSLKVTSLNFDKAATIRTNGTAVETTNISCGTLDLDNSNITITGSILDSNTVPTGSSTYNYSSYFNRTNGLRVAQNSGNAINLSNSSFTLECWAWTVPDYMGQWIWPEPNGSSNTALSPKMNLISKITSSDPRSWSRDWEFGLEPHTGRPQFYNGTSTYTGNTVVNEYAWNHIAVTFTGANRGMAGGGGGQDGASLFDGKPEYRGRSGYTVGNTAIAAPQTLPVTTFWSNYFDGTDDRINIADSAKSHVGSGAFTLELWIYNTGFDPSGNMLFEKGRFSVGREIRAYMTATQIVFEGNVSATATGTYTTITATTTNQLNTWYHLAFIRSGNTLYIFRNGSLLTSGALTGTIFNTTEPMTIGPADGNNNYIINGYVSNVRLITGQALTTTSYTVPTSPLTKTSTGWAGVSLTGTVALLTCNSNKFVDNSDNPAPIGIGGGIPQITSFSPFGSTYNGSVVFNNGNYIETPYSSDLDLSTGEDWTIECWFTLPNVTSNNAHSLMGMSNGAGQVNKWLLAVNMSTGFGYQANRVGFVTVVGGVNQWINSNYTWQSGKWYHIAAVYTSSDTSIKLYVNGASMGSVATNVSATTGVLRIGADGELYRAFNGYIKDARVVKGTALYTAPIPNEAVYTTPGTYTWTAPAGVTSVSAVAIGGGGSGYAGGGGGLGWKNNITVVPGQSYTVVVGAGGTQGVLSDGGNSFFINTSTVAGFGGKAGVGAGGGYVGDGGGNGGGGGGTLQWLYVYGGGGGAGGYSGNGSAGGGGGPYGSGNYDASNAPAGGGGMGGDGWFFDSGGVQARAGAGGGVGIYGQGSSGSRINGQSWPNGAGQGGSGGSAGENPYYFQNASYGGLYGGGGAGNLSRGGSGAVRLIWGTGVSYPTNAAIWLPTQPLTPVTNTKLLVCQGNGYFDSNTQLTPKTITVVSGGTGALSPRIEEVSPFYTANTVASNSFVSSTTLPTILSTQGPLQGGSPPVHNYGGGGGGGYWGGSGGGYAESNTMGGGGGGSSYVHPTLVTSSTIYNGYYSTAGNASDADRGTSGNGGSTNTVGQDGKLIITYGATTLTYSTAQFDTAWTCPGGVTSIQVKAWGAGGAGGTVGGWGVGFPGGAGACVTGTLSVTPGTTYYLTVGGGGQVNGGGYIIGGGGIVNINSYDVRYGSSGGGLTGIFNASPATQASALLIAGGGGGGGSSRNTQQLAIYLNGTAILREATMTNVAHTNTTQLILGDYLTGYLKDVRIVKNAVVYNGTFTTPTSPLGIHSEGTTELLTCQTDSLIDLSTTPKTITTSGAVSRKLFSPSAVSDSSVITFTGNSDTTAYISGNIGSIINNKQYTLPSSNNGPVANSYSVLHDGLTQQSTLQATTQTQTLSLQSENFTIECWLYPIRWNTMGSSGHPIATTMRDSPTYGWAVGFQPTTMDFTVWGTSASSTTANYTFSLNTWYHLVWQRTSSGMEFYVNGQLVTNNDPTNRRTYTGGNDSAPLSFGTYVQNLSYRGNGSWRVSNFRIVKNATVYNSGNFTPTLPTVTANTVFLGLNTDTFTDQAGTISGFTTIGTAPVILGNSDYDGTGRLILPLRALNSNYKAATINSVSIGAGNYAKLFKFSNASSARTNSEGLNANLYVGGDLWSNASTYYMSNFGNLGSGYAHGPMIASSYIYTRTELPAHTHIKYRCYWHFVSSTDNETSWLEIDGVRYLQFTKNYTDTFAATTPILLLNQFSFVPASYSDTGGNPALYQAGNGYFIIDTGQIGHTSSSISVNHFSGVDQVRTDEAAYLSHVELVLYNNGVEVATVPQSDVLNVNNFSINGSLTYKTYLLGALNQPSSAQTMLFNYLAIRNSQVTGGNAAYWTADNSTDYGSNTGWSFGAAATPEYYRNFLFFFVT